MCIKCEATRQKCSFDTRVKPVRKRKGEVKKEEEDRAPKRQRSGTLKGKGKEKALESLVLAQEGELDPDGHYDHPIWDRISASRPGRSMQVMLEDQYDAYQLLCQAESHLAIARLRVNTAANRGGREVVKKPA